MSDSAQILNQYQQYLQRQGLSPATIERKLSSVRAYLAFLESKELRAPSAELTTNYLLLTTETQRQKLENLGIKVKVSGESFFSQLLFARLAKRAFKTVKSIPQWHYTLLYSLKYRRPNWLIRYQKHPASRYLNLAFLILICIILGIGGYEQFSQKVPSGKILGLPTQVPTYLSFQGRLTDSSGNPITAETHFRFSLYDDLVASGSAVGVDSFLWEEAKWIQPDTDGIFNTLIGDITVLEKIIFRDNTELWLGITVNENEEMTDRQQIATVAYAFNSQYLQGYGIGESGIANINNVPVVNGNGEIIIAAAGPALKTTSGTFKIESPTLALMAAVGSGNVGIGTSSPSQKFQINNSGTSAFVVTSAGQVGIGTTNPSQKLDVNGNLNVGGTGIFGSLRINGALFDNSNSPGAAGLILKSTGTGVSWSSVSDLSVGDADTLDGLDSLQFLRSDTSDNFTSGTLTFDSGTILNLAVGSSFEANGDLFISDTDISFGGVSTNFTTSGNFSLNGSQFFLNQGSGNVGIGTTSPTALLDINGKVSILSNSNNNDSAFEFGNGFDPSLSNYHNEMFSVNSFFRNPSFSSGVAINYLLRTEESDNASWVKTDIGAVTANGVRAPDGTLTAENIPAGSNNDANIAQTITNSTTGYWTAGIWARSQNGTATIKLRLDSSAETGTEKEISLDTQWRFFTITQNLAVAHTTKTFRIISGTNAISLWGARLNPGQTANAYYARTSSALTSATPGVFFNNTPVYATTFSGSLSGNASTANYSLYGSFGGYTLSNTSDKTNQWEYLGNMYLVYNATYRYGWSWNVELKIKELTNNTDKSYDQLEDVQLVLRGYIGTVADATAFNNTVPSFSIEVANNNLGLTTDDVAMLVYSTDIAAKYLRVYVKLKNPNTHYTIVPINRYGAAYSSTGGKSTSYCSFNYANDQAVVGSLPTPAQGSIAYANWSQNTNFWRITSSGDIYNWNSGNIGIGTTNPSQKLDVNGNLNVSGTGIFSNVRISGGSPAVNKVLTSVDASGNATWSEITSVGVGGSGTANYLPLWLNGGKTLGDSTLYQSSGSLYLPGSGVWDSSGNVGIGTTGNKNKLDVNGSLAVGTYAGVYSAPANSLIVSGNVGIGTTSPGTKLEVNSGILRISQALGSSSLQFADTSGNVKAIDFINSLGNRIFNVGGTATTSINSSGNLGIGTTDPQHKLDVNGNVKVSGSTVVDNDLTVNGIVGIGATNPSYKLN
ncbi:MAG TPA: hypothetical protein VMW04_01300, partial [Patescibacteria group bacterium]|nr:hypothetical protein [Patescibacteria group bacterium]